MATKNIKVIEVTSELGAGTRGASLGSTALYLEEYDRGENILSKYERTTVSDLNTVMAQPTEFSNAKYINAIAETTEAIAAEVESVLQSGAFPLVLSGDHSNAAGTIAGIKNYYNDKRVGVVWIDAHADIHTPYTTPSGNVHGMPIAASLGLDNKEMTVNTLNKDTMSYWEAIKKAGSKRISPKIVAEDIVFIGIRDLEQQEWDTVKKLNIKHYEPRDVKQLGIDTIAAQTLGYLNDCDLIYISFDVDSMDTSISKGTGTPVDNGLALEEAATILKTLVHHPKTTVLEVTEINPLLDTENEMAKAVLGLLKKVL